MMLGACILMLEALRKHSPKHFFTIFLIFLNLSKNLALLEHDFSMLQALLKHCS